MKFKTTNKYIRALYGDCVIRIPYGDAQDLLRYEDPIAYTCGVYGWNADFYAIDGTAICTGYRSLVGQCVDYDLLHQYNTKARKIADDRRRGYDSKARAVRKLLCEFINKTLTEG